MVLAASPRLSFHFLLQTLLHPSLPPAQNLLLSLTEVFFLSHPTPQAFLSCSCQQSTSSLCCCIVLHIRLVFTCIAFPWLDSHCTELRGVDMANMALKWHCFVWHFIVGHCIALRFSSDVCLCYIYCTIMNQGTFLLVFSVSVAPLHHCAITPYTTAFFWWCSPPCCTCCTMPPPPCQR